MNKLFLIFVLMLAGCLPAFAQTNTISDAKVLEFLNSPMNFVKNPFARYNTNDVTCVNATKNRDVVTDPLFGISAHTFVGTALNGYCEYALRPIDNPYKDFKGGCEFGVFIKGDASLYSLIIYDGTATEKIRSASTLGNNTGFTYYSLPYQCQATPRIRLVQTAAGTGQTVRLGVYYGPAKSIAYGTPTSRFSAKISATGVVTEENEDFINGNCTVDTNGVVGCNFVSRKFTQRPHCHSERIIEGATAFSPNNTTATMGATTTSAVYVIPTTGNASGFVSDIILKCDRAGTDSVQPAVTAQNWNYDWRPLNPSAAQQGLGNITVANPMECKEKRDGGDWLIDCRFTTGTVSAVEGRFALKPGLTIDNTRAPASTLCGHWWRNSATANTARTGAMLCIPGNAFFQFAFDYYNGTSSPFSPQNGTNVFTNSEIAHFTARVPVKENGVSWQETWNALQLNGSVVADTNVKADKAAGITSIDYGTSSTTITGVSNVSSVNSPGGCTFTRIGSVVRGSCSVRFQCTSGSGTTTQVDFTLPVPTILATSTFRGTVGSGNVNETGYAIGTATNQGQIVLKCQYTGAPDTRIVSFEYLVP